MTMTDNGRVDEELVARGRELIKDGQMPSKRRLREHLRKDWGTVNGVLTRLAAEHRAAKAARRREALRQLTPRKRSGALPVRGRERQRTVNETAPATTGRRRPASWPVVVIAMPAFAAVWSGWVGLGGLTGFGVIQPFPGIPGLEDVRLDTAITLPVGVETYGAYALYIWLSGRAATKTARRFAMWSAFVSLALGAAGQVTYHLLVSDGPWVITTAVSCLPVAVLGMAAALRHLVHAEEN